VWRTRNRKQEENDGEKKISGDFDSVEAEVTSGGRLFQNLEAASGNWKRTITNSGQPSARMTETIGNGDALDVVGKITVAPALASVGEHS